MSTLLESVRAVGAALDEVGARWALIGGLAVSVRCEPRFTRDIDVAVATADDAEAERLILHLRERGFAAVTVMEQTAVGCLATVRVTSPEGVVIDLMFGSSGIEREVVDEAERLDVGSGIVAPVCRAGHLIALKLLARHDIERPQDLVDLHALLASSPPREIERARDAVRLIASRGFHRGRTLEQDLAAIERERSGRR